MKIDDLSNIDYLRECLLSKVVNKELREKIKHSSSLSYLRDQYYKLNHPVIKKESYGYY